MNYVFEVALEECLLLLRQPCMMLSVFLTFFMMAAAWAVMSDEDFAKLCEKGTAKEIRAALKKGANPNAKDDNAVTALMVAAIDNPEAVSLLLEVGADVNAKDDYGRTALDLAQEMDNVEAAKVLKAAR